MDKIEMAIKRLGLKSVKINISAGEIKKAHQEVLNDIRPIIEEMDKWTKESAKNFFKRCEYCNLRNNCSF